jgi:hypothetical protein
MSTVAEINNIDVLEAAMVRECRPIICPLKHKFIPGFYIREIFMPKGIDNEVNLVTSRVHNTYHPFFVLKGKVAVFSENDGEQIIEAPYSGVTTPNTRRVLKIIEDTVWVTVHATDIVPENDSEEAVEEAANKVAEIILAKHENPLLGGHFVNNNFVEQENSILIK